VQRCCKDNGDLPFRMEISQVWNEWKTVIGS
jgi:hypothetical protein